MVGEKHGPARYFNWAMRKSTGTFFGVYSVSLSKYSDDFVPFPAIGIIIGNLIQN